MSMQMKLILIAFLVLMFGCKAIAGEGTDDNAYKLEWWKGYTLAPEMAGKPVDAIDHSLIPPHNPAWVKAEWWRCSNCSSRTDTPHKRDVYRNEGGCYAEPTEIVEGEDFVLNTSSFSLEPVGVEGYLGSSPCPHCGYIPAISHVSKDDCIKHLKKRLEECR